MNLLLEEFLSSGDHDEAMRCLKELEVPHFHHELVYEVAPFHLSAVCCLVVVLLLYYMCACACVCCSGRSAEAGSSLD